MQDYTYGLDYEEDIRKLYGKDYKAINNKRFELCDSLNPNVLEVKILRNIIQNPMPITKEQLDEWKNIRDKLINQYGYYLSDNDKDILNEIYNFAYIYHVKE